MPRYIIERSFADGFAFPAGIAGANACRALIETNDEVGVTWLHSYVRDDRRAMFCIYDAPTPEAIRRASVRNRLPVERITRVTILEPYSFGASDLDRERSDMSAISASTALAASEVIPTQEKARDQN